jgi:hypothetical protein
MRHRPTEKRPRHRFVLDSHKKKSTVTITQRIGDISANQHQHNLGLQMASLKAKAMSRSLITFKISATYNSNAPTFATGPMFALGRVNHDN